MLCRILRSSRKYSKHSVVYPVWKGRFSNGKSYLTILFFLVLSLQLTSDVILPKTDMPLFSFYFCVYFFLQYFFSSLFLFLFFTCKHLYIVPFSFNFLLHCSGAPVQCYYMGNFRSNWLIHIHLRNVHSSSRKLQCSNLLASLATGSFKGQCHTHRTCLLRLYFFWSFFHSWVTSLGINASSKIKEISVSVNITCYPVVWQNG